MKQLNEIDLIAHTLGASGITQRVGVLIETFTPLADYYSREHAALNPPRDHLVYMLRRLHRACLVYNRRSIRRSALAYIAVNNCYQILLRETLIALEDKPRVTFHRI